MLTVEKVESLLRPVLAGSELELLDVKLMSGKARAAFVVVIDHRHRPIGVDEISALSRRFEDVLDMDEHVPRRYSLDVTSPGVRHPLVYEWEYAKNIGRRLVVEVAPEQGAGEQQPATGEEKQRGRATAEQPESFDAELTDVSGGRLTFDNGRVVPIERVRRARVKLPW
ncbi:MAG: Ribosome maturation factor RimP [Calditrichaeota bacterium]|nr:Ribosome maturation factor RimP [Calditrichota bacterium]